MNYLLGFLAVLTLASLAFSAAIFLKTKKDRELKIAVLGAIPAAVISSVVLGAFVAFVVLQIQHNQEKRDNRDAQNETARLEETRVLLTIQDDLKYNLRILNERSEVEGLNGREALLNRILSEPLRTNYWQSISNSGDSKWISDRPLLYAISNAYAALDQTAYWEQAVRSITVTSAVAASSAVNGVEVSLLDQAVDDALGTYATTSAALNSALSKVDEQVNKIKI